MLRLLLALFFGLFLILSLASYSIADPSWWRVSPHKFSKMPVINHAGIMGAQLADTLYLIFGSSAWFCPLIVAHWMRMEFHHSHRKSALSGWLLIMTGVSIFFELFASHRMYALPSGPGGYLAVKAVAVGPWIIGGWGLLMSAGFSILTGVLIVAPFNLAYVMMRIQHLSARFFVRKQLIQSDRGGSKKTIKSHFLEDVSLATPKASEPQSIWVQDGQRLIEKLKEYGVSAKVVNIIEGPVIVRFELQLAAGERGQKIANLSKDLSRTLKMGPINVIQHVPGKPVMAVEVPQPKRQLIPYYPLLKESLTYGTLPLILGVTPQGDSVLTDLAKLPHLLVAGSTGSGKSVAVNAMILSLIASAHRTAMKFLLIDPKILEFACYQNLEQLAAPVITEPHHAVAALRWCVDLMQQRYKILAEHQVQHIAQYHHNIGEKAIKDMPYFVVIIDELADLMLMTKKAVEEPIARIAQKARACGIHLIIATQRPSVDVITGLIKANIPARIALAVSSKIDSRTVLDQQGAENLLGAGDALFLSPNGHHIERVHGAYVSDTERKTVLDECSQKAPEFMISLEELCSRYGDEQFD